MPSSRVIAVASLVAVISTPPVIGAQSAQPASQQAAPRATPTPEQKQLEHDADSAYAAKDYQHAAALFERLTRIDSTLPRYWVKLGNSAALTQDYKTGARAFARASALRAGPAATYNVGAMLARLGQTDSAFAWLSRAVQTGFADTATLGSDEDLASLRGDARFAKLRQQASVAPSPCRDDPNYRRFDFWVGNWRVTTVGGTQVGTSHVDVVSGGCALLENWRDMRGGEGKSLNTFDPATGGWRQFWVGQAGNVTDYSVGEWNGSTLTYTAHSRGANGRPDLILHMMFSPLDSGVVRQFGEASTDGGKTWGSSFDFHYHPVK